MKIDKPIQPGPLRAKAYQNIGDQLDAIIKTFAHLQAQGIDIGKEGKALVAHSQEVKNRFKKKA